MGLRWCESELGLPVVLIRVVRCVGHVVTLGKWVGVDDGLVRLVQSVHCAGARWTV